jgi:hypothetical protein
MGTIGAAGKGRSAENGGPMAATLSLRPIGRSGNSAVMDRIPKAAPCGETMAARGRPAFDRSRLRH